MSETQTEQPGPGPGHWLVFQCGHKTPNVMIRQRKSGSSIVRECPICRAKLVDKIFTCQDCGKSFYGGISMNWKRVRCCDCAGVRKKTRRYLPKKGDLRPKGNGARLQVAKTDCIFYENECLPRVALKNQNCTPCDGCERYTPAPMHATLLSAGDSFQVASFY